MPFSKVQHPFPCYLQGYLSFPDTRRGLCLTCSPTWIFILPLSVPYHSGTRLSVLRKVFFILPQTKMTAGRAHQLSKPLLTGCEQHIKLWHSSFKEKGYWRGKIHAPYRGHRQQNSTSSQQPHCMWRISSFPKHTSTYSKDGSHGGLSPDLLWCLCLVLQQISTQSWVESFSSFSSLSWSSSTRKPFRYSDLPRKGSFPFAHS